MGATHGRRQRNVVSRDHRQDHRGIKTLVATGKSVATRGAQHSGGAVRRRRLFRFRLLRLADQDSDHRWTRCWDVERETRLVRQKTMGLVPPETRLPARNDGVEAWDEHTPDEQRVFTRLQSAFAGMLDHADLHLARLIGFLDEARVRDNTLILVLSDNGASQEGGPLGFVNAMGPYNLRPESMSEKLRRIDDIGGPDTHSNFPHGWAMAYNTPLRRYKQNTHGGGIRDPLVMVWPKRIAAKGEMRHQFVHASDLAPTLLELIGIAAPAVIAGCAQMPIEGESFVRSIDDAAAPSRASAQYFEMFGRRDPLPPTAAAKKSMPPSSNRGSCPIKTPEREIALLAPI
jgi:arylsulfatase A-like enzyme